MEQGITETKEQTAELEIIYWRMKKPSLLFVSWIFQVPMRIARESNLGLSDFMKFYSFRLFGSFFKGAFSGLR